MTSSFFRQYALPSFPFPNCFNYFVLLTTLITICVYLFSLIQHSRLYIIFLLPYFILVRSIFPRNLILSYFIYRNINPISSNTIIKSYANKSTKMPLLLEQAYFRPVFIRALSTLVYSYYANPHFYFPHYFSHVNNFKYIPKFP